MSWIDFISIIESHENLSKITSFSGAVGLIIDSNYIANRWRWWSRYKYSWISIQDLLRYVINYAGFFPIDIFSKPKVIHYVFFPSQSDQSNDPVLVWFGGVPGCSSLLTCFHENGPFVFEPGKMTFTYNKNSWNKKANLLFFELPGAVGFS